MSATLGEGSKRYEDTWVFRRAGFRKVKEQKANIFQAVKLDEGPNEQSGTETFWSWIPRKLGASESGGKRYKGKYLSFRARHGFQVERLRIPRDLGLFWSCSKFECQSQRNIKQELRKADLCESLSQAQERNEIGLAITSNPRLKFTTIKQLLLIKWHSSIR